MTTRQFESQLKEINENLNIKPSAVSDMEGIYYGDIYICGIPSNNIYEEVKPDYKNDLGTPHKTSLVAKAQVENWLANLEENLEIEKDFNALQQYDKHLNTGETEQKLGDETKPLSEEIKPERGEKHAEDLSASTEV